MANTNLADLIKVVSKFAPLLASVLPIPGAAIIGQVIASTFGGDISKPDELAQKIEKDSDNSVKLATIESNMKVQLEQIAATNLQNNLLAQKATQDTQVAIIQSDQLDRSNARELAVKSYMPAVISSIVLLGFFTSIFMIMFQGQAFDKADQNILFMLFGTMTSAFSSVIAFWLGSNASTKDKDATISTALKANDAAAVTAQEVKTKLAQTETDTDKKLQDIGKVSESIHTLVNSNMGVQLKLNATLADRIAAMTGDQNDIDSAKEAHAILAEHNAKQEVVDSNADKKAVPPK